MTSDFGHVGVYIGNNEVIECTLSSFGDGVVKTKFSDRGWSWWCQCPCIEDDTGVCGGSLDGKNSVGKTNAPVNVREKASINSKVLFKLGKGVQVKLTGESVENGGICWLGVMIDGKVGYCDGMWVNR